MEIMGRVAILMSTYNGQNYIADQIYSIIHQTYTDWNLFIRDDGSTDNTLKIIKEFEKKDDRIHLIDINSGKNLGPAQSFFYLLMNVDAEYYFFCDQDDYWKSKKIEILLSIIKKYEDIPCLVYSNLQVVDSKLRSIPSSFDNMIGKVYGNNRFIDNDIAGCSMVINSKLKYLLLKGEKKLASVFMHDWWLAMICEKFGKIIFCDKKLLLYRQHDSNVMGAGTQNKPILYRLINNFDKRKAYLARIYKQINLYHSIYSDDLNKLNDSFISDYLDSCKKGMIARYRFLINNNIHRFSILQTISFYILFIFMGGKI